MATIKVSTEKIWDSTQQSECSATSDVHDNGTFSFKIIMLDNKEISDTLKDIAKTLEDMHDSHICYEDRMRLMMIQAELINIICRQPTGLVEGAINPIADKIR